MFSAILVCIVISYYGTTSMWWCFSFSSAYDFLFLNSALMPSISNSIIWFSKSVNRKLFEFIYYCYFVFFLSFYFDYIYFLSAWLFCMFIYFNIFLLWLWFMWEINDLGILFIYFYCTSFKSKFIKAVCSLFYNYWYF